MVEMHSEILQGILSTLLNLVMSEDCRNQWSMSRPLLVLILLYEDYFGWVAWYPFKKIVDNDCCIPFSSLKESVIRAQPIEKQEFMVQWFNGLMEGIERNLTVKNRERWVTESVESFWLDIFVFVFRFTQNLSMFRRDITNSLKSSNYNTGSSINDMIVS